jgi:hypothetical protein
MASFALPDWHTARSLGRPRGREEPQARKVSVGRGTRKNGSEGRL